MCSLGGAIHALRHTLINKQAGKNAYVHKQNLNCTRVSANKYVNSILKIPSTATLNRKRLKTKQKSSKKCTSDKLEQEKKISSRPGSGKCDASPSAFRRHYFIRY